MRGSVKALVYVVILVLLVSAFAFSVYSYTRRVTGTSMFPTLEDGDLVFLEQVPFNSISVGDIIVYNPPCAAESFSVIHRIVAISDGGFITKGDNNGVTDQAAGIATGPVTAACIEGEVVFVIPYVERLADLPYGVNYVIAALVVIFVLYSELKPRGEEVETPATAAPP